jgi:hypothetical protein
MVRTVGKTALAVVLAPAMRGKMVAAPPAAVVR